jgi:hypothetical protein
MAYKLLAKASQQVHDEHKIKNAYDEINFKIQQQMKSQLMDKKYPNKISATIPI